MHFYSLYSSPSVPLGFSFANQLKFYRKKLKLNIDCVTTTKTTSFNKYICSSIKTINPVVCCYWYCVRRSTHNAIPLFGMPFVNDSYIVQPITISSFYFDVTNKLRLCIIRFSSTAAVLLCVDVLQLVGFERVMFVFGTNAVEMERF